MTDLSDLIKRVESAVGNDPQIDEMIAVAFDAAPEGFTYSANEGAWQRYDGVHDSVMFWEPPAYTVSLDAALDLVEEKLPDREWSVGRDDENRRCWASIDDDNWDEAMDSTAGLGKTPALAVLSALLNVLKSQSSDSSPPPKDGG